MKRRFSWKKRAVGAVFDLLGELRGSAEAGDDMYTGPTFVVVGELAQNASQIRRCGHM